MTDQRVRVRAQTPQSLFKVDFGSLHIRKFFRALAETAIYYENIERANRRLFKDNEKLKKQIKSMEAKNETT